MIFLAIITYLLPIDGWETEAIDELRIRGKIFATFTTIKPYSYALVDDLIKSDTTQWDATTKLLVNRLQKFYHKQGFGSVASLRYVCDTARRMFVCSGLNYSAGKFSADITLVTKYGKSDEFPPLTWRYPNKNIMLGIELCKAYLYSKIKNVELIVGRLPVRWDYGLLISGSTVPYDLISLRLRHNNLLLTYLFIALDQYVPEETNTPLNRYLCAHRIDIALFNYRLLFALNEGVLFVRHDALSAIYYLSPITIYRIAAYNLQFGRPRYGGYPFDDDIYAGFTATLYLRNTKLYFEWLFDDLGFFSNVLMEDILNDGPFAYVIGVERTDLWLRRTLWKFQYLHVNAYCYWHILPRNYFVYMGYPLAHRLGSDFDITLLKVTYHWDTATDIDVSIDLTRKGKTHLAMDAPRPPGNCFLWGTPQISFTVAAGIRMFLHPWHCALKLYYIKIRNYHNEYGCSHQTYGITFYGRIKF